MERVRNTSKERKRIEREKEMWDQKSIQMRRNGSQRRKKEDKSDNKKEEGSSRRMRKR